MNKYYKLSVSILLESVNNEEPLTVIFELFSKDKTIVFDKSLIKEAQGFILKELGNYKESSKDVEKIMDRTIRTFNLFKITYSVPSLGLSVTKKRKLIWW